MKILCSLLFLLTTFSICKAQYISVDTPVYKVVRQDTINIHGMVYDVLNHPVSFLQIYSQNRQMVYLGYPIYTQTDSVGRFKLNGALIKDTLELYWDKKDIRIINNGSRYVEIHLPAITTNDLGEPLIGITAKRKIKKKPEPTFKVLTNAHIWDYGGIGVVSEAAYRNGERQGFIDLIRSNISYPAKAIENNIEGDVEIAFTVEKDGSLDNFRIIHGLGYGCDEQVINAIKKSAKWRPANYAGRRTENEFSVTINFKLTDK